MNKKGKRGFKMKGFCPKSSSPMRKLGDLKKSDGSDKSARRIAAENRLLQFCLLYTSPSPRDVEESRMPSSA